MVDMEEGRANDKLVVLAFAFALILILALALSLALDDGSVLETGSVTFLMALDLAATCSGLVGAKPLHTEIVAVPAAATSTHL